MPKHLLVKISADPRSSPRAAEAVRIAAGVGAWQKVRVDLYLEGPARECLSEFPEELEGGPILAQYLPAIAQHGGVIYTEAPANQPDYTIEFAAESNGPAAIDCDKILDDLFAPPAA